MNQNEHEPVVKDPVEQGPRSRWTQLLLGLLFGIAFGFFLQKGGAGKYHILVGVLLLEDWTVIQIMLSAMVVGMIGLFPMAAAGWIELKPKPTRYAANIIGGLLFGAGFALAAYCPGTSAAAFGQGNYDALAVMIGLIGGSWVYAETSGWTSQHIESHGDRGKLTLPDLLPTSRAVTVALAVVVLGAVATAFAWIPTL